MSEDSSYNLIWAVRTGELETARTLIDTFGLSYSKAWSSGYILLLEALVKKHEEVAKLLLERGSEVNSKSKEPTATPLHWAVMRGYINIVTMLLDRNADVNVMDNCSNTPLHCAVERCNLEIVKLLLKREVFIDARANGMTSLHRAAELNYLAMAEELLNYGAQVNMRCTARWKADYTPLHCAAEHGNESMIKLLLSNGAKINAIAVNNITPLHVATQLKREKIVKLLLEKGANVDACDKNGKSILLVAVEGDHLTTIEYILHFHPDINSETNRKSLIAAIKKTVHGESQKIVDALLDYGFTVRSEDVKDSSLLHGAVKRGYVKIIETLLKLGADVNTLNNTDQTLLHSAVLTRQFKIAKLLLRHGANPNAKDNRQKQPIFYAIWKNDMNITKLFLGNGNRVEVTTELLFPAVEQENREIVEILLQFEPNMDINARNQYGSTVLHYTAITDGRPFFPEENCISNEKSVDARREMAKMFLSRGACVNAKTENGITALHLAARGGGIMVVELLLKMKADVNALAEDLTTPLHLAVKKDNEPIVKMLLDYGANIHARQENGSTALHIASKNGCENVVKLLVEQGADVDAEDAEKSLPLHLATVGGYHYVVNTLLEHDADVEAKDKLGRTALHIAASHRWPKITAILLEYGADINVTCKTSQTALDYATLGMTCFKIRLICEEVANILVQYIVIMKALGLYVSDKNLGAVDLQYVDRDIVEDYQMEIANMKIKKIGNSKVRYYDILTRDINKLAGYARNESIVEDLESTYFKCEFPLYRGMITRRFKKGQKRESLLSSSLKSLNALSGYLLPDVSAIVLFYYLSNKDLENLIKADPRATDSYN